MSVPKPEPPKIQIRKEGSYVLAIALMVFAAVIFCKAAYVYIKLTESVLR